MLTFTAYIVADKHTVSSVLYSFALVFYVLETLALLTFSC